MEEGRREPRSIKAVRVRGNSHCFLWLLLVDLSLSISPPRLHGLNRSGKIWSGKFSHLKSYGSLHLARELDDATLPYACT